AEDDHQSLTLGSTARRTRPLLSLRVRNSSSPMDCRISSAWDWDSWPPPPLTPWSSRPPPPPAPCCGFPCAPPPPDGGVLFDAPPPEWRLIASSRFHLAAWWCGLSSNAS